MNWALNDWNSPITWILGSVSLLTLLYRYVTSDNDYFSKQNIRGPKPLPIVGNLWGVWKKDMQEHDMELVKKYGKLFGTFDGFLPNLFISDPELIKQVFIKDFESFINRRDFFNDDKYLRMFISLMKDQEWKDVRSSVSPTFTSGKIKRMSKLINKCALQFVEKFRVVAKTQGKLNAKQLKLIYREFSNLTMDIIATCGFGMKIQSLGDKDDPFMSRASVLFDSPITRTPGVLIPFVFPRLAAMLGNTFLSLKMFNFFFDIVKNVIQERKKNGEKYDDFIDLMLESVEEVSKANSSNGGRVWNQDEIEEIIVAQSVLFLLAGYDTTATTLNNCIFFLAKNPDLQEKLYNDIQEQLETFEEVTHECIQNLPYADNFIHEVLRLAPPVIRLERLCNKDIKYGDISIRKGTIVSAPIYTIHHSAEHYPDPERFDPDRWTNEVKATRSPYVFAPFGLGPRNCVGMRFALEELKMVLCIMVKEFRFFEVDETPEKLKIKHGFNLLAQPTNIIVGLEERA